MKYSFQLIIRDETENKDILRLDGRSITRSKSNCIKDVRRTINGTLKRMLERIEEENNQG